jgi:hypothetical protein
VLVLVLVAVFAQSGQDHDHGKNGTVI